MFSIGNYEVTRLIYEGNKTVIYQARHSMTHETVLVKALRAEYPPVEDVVRIKREYEISKAADIDGVIRPIAIERFKNSYALIQEGFTGETLHALLKQDGLDLYLFLEVAIRLADIVGQLHEKNIIHKDIKPHNIIVNQSLGVVKITDFGISTLLSGEQQEMLNPSHLEGTLQYMSPEQTGRMNRRIDYRTDFYSLGITFYELLTGAVPFQAHDPLEVIHSHIAKQVPPPHESRTDLPYALSRIIMKCLAKNAEDRYQSAFGLKRDLETCYEQLLEFGEITPFELGLDDSSDLFQIPEKLYGRDQDIDTLNTVFERVSRGACELLLVSGYSGIGKSFLVHEVKGPIGRANGFFVSGKFNQFKRHIPYDALIQALKQLIHQLLTESEQSIGHWKEEILRVLAPNGQALIDVIPELELIIGKQPPLTQLSPLETQNRFQMAMQNFINVFAKKEHPFVLFLDDLQWADSASLNMIEYIMSDSNTAFLLFVGTYRKEEVSTSDRLMVMVDELRQKAVSINLISLKPLSFEHVHQMIADTLQSPLERTVELARLVMRKTNGNPFFTKQFLEALHKQGAVTRDYAHGVWRWELDAIEGMGITDNVVEFMLAKIQTLPERLQHLLQVAACLGSSFDVKALAFAMDSDPQDVAHDLQQAAQDGVVLPNSKVYRWSLGRVQVGADLARVDEFDLSYKFLHDRVQQAAYSLLGEEQRREFHLKIGRWMMGRGLTEQGEDHLFDMLNHLIQARTRIHVVDERYQVARLCLEAARRAKASTAYEPALEYLQNGVLLLPLGSWETEYELAFALNLERSEVQYLCGQFETAEQSFVLLLTNAKFARDKAKVCAIKMVLYANQGRYEDVVAVGNDALALLGLKMPKKVSRLTLFRKLLITQWRLRGKSMEDLLQIPETTDPDMHEAAKTMLNMMPALYVIDPIFSLYFNLEIVNLSLDRGYSSVTYHGFLGYGMYLGSFTGKYDAGYEYGQLALQVDEKVYPESGGSNKGLFHVAYGIDSWRNHVRESIQAYKIVYQKSLEVGDLVFAVYAVHNLLHNMLFAGCPLDEVYQEAQKYFDFVKRVNVGDTTYSYLMHRALVSNLKGLTQGPLGLTDDHFDEATFESMMFDQGFHHPRGFYYYHRMKMFYLHGQYAEALGMAEQSDEMDSYFVGHLYLPENDFYYALTMAALYEDASPSDQKRFLKKLKQLQKQMDKWAHFCPENFGHKANLIAAEIARISGHVKTAMDLYDQAISSANEHQFIQNAAIASECAARFFLRQGKAKIAAPYLIEAHYGFLNWGATTKVENLEREFPHVLVTETEGKLSDTMSRTRMINQTVQRTKHMQLSVVEKTNIDLLAVLKSTRSISGEIVLANLLEKLIGVVVQQSSAQKVVLLVEADGELYVQAEKRSDGEEVLVATASIPYQERTDLPQSIIQYVRRTKENVLLFDASQSVIFAQDPYLIAEQPKSMLCLPLLKGGRLVAVLYLENNLLTYAFTEERLEVLTLMSSQIAVSLEHAGLYQQQVLLNEAYQRFVPDQFLRFLQKKSITDVQLGDYVQTDMSVQFSKIRGFLGMTERMSAEESFTFLNEYLSQMEPLVTEYGGFIDKYIRDSIMSLFDKGADDAVRAAIAMLRRLHDYNAGRLAQGAEPITVGMGINTGTLMLGTLGGASRMDSTVISDAVNLASRIEGLSEEYDVSLLISEHTYSRLLEPASYRIRIIDRLAVRGKSEAVSVYEVYDADPAQMRDAKLATQPLFEKAYGLYHGGSITQAEELFRECARVNPQDPVVQLYLQRCLEHSLITNS